MIVESQIVPYQVSTVPEGSWLIFAPHADDESFGMGGSLLLAKGLGLRVTLAIMTDGALGGSQQDLVALREQEARRAADLLGISQVHFLREADRGVHVSARLVARVEALIRSAKADFVFFPAPFEPHPDHRTTAMVVWQALGVLDERSRPTPVSYEITVQSPVNRLVDITQMMPAKLRVCSCYESQLGENNYLAVVAALNQARTFSLPAAVKYAEGFFHYPPSACGRPLLDSLLNLPLLSKESLAVSVTDQC